MISKARIKYIHSLELKKNRKAERVFVAEGPKVVGDLLDVRSAKLIIATREWLSLNGHRLSARTEIVEVSEEELCKASFLQHPQDVIAVFPQWEEGDITILAEELSLVLDGVQDPGNLGTIIRIADWFGIKHIYCSPSTADVYNPKVVQATMGSIARVCVQYCNLLSLLDNLPPEIPVYGTLLDGNNIYQQDLTSRGIIVMGNEGNGISPEIRQRINHKLFIPNFPMGCETAESLNVAVATAITCAEFRRQENAFKN